MNSDDSLVRVLFFELVDQFDITCSICRFSTSQFCFDLLGRLLSSGVAT